MLKKKSTIITILLALVAMAGQAQTIPPDWFKTDTITIRGRIEGYDAEQFGFTTMQCYYEDVFEKDQATQVLDIAPDGTFKKSFVASYPSMNRFYTHNSKVDFDEIPFFARPGETIDISVRPNEQGKYECFYNNGSSKDVERWLKSRQMMNGQCRALSSFEGRFCDVQTVADSVWQNLMRCVSSVSQQFHYTPFEVQMAQAEAQRMFLSAMMTCADRRNMNNYIRKDTYHETKYKEFMREMYYDENQSYSMNPGDGHVPCVRPSHPGPAPLPSQTRDEPVTDSSRTRDESLTQDRIGKSKDRLGYSILSKEFEDLWQIYPKKQGKQNAFKAYEKARREGVEYEDVLNGIKAYAEYAKTKDPQYIKMGSSFFNQRAWQDDWSIKDGRKGFNEYGNEPSQDGFGAEPEGWDTIFGA
jgi:hypothetical protein